MRKRTKKGKNKSFSKKDIQRLCLSFLKNNPGKSFNYKQLSKLLKIKDFQTKTHLKDVLSSLSSDGILKEVKRGSYGVVSKSLIESGVVVSSNKSGLFLSVENIKEDVFVSYDNSLFSLIGDSVKVSIYKKKDSLFFGEITKVVTRKRDCFVGVLEKSSTYGFVVPEGNVSFDIYVPKSGFNFNDVDKKVLVKVVDWDDSQKNPVGKIIEILGDPKNHDVEMNSILYQYNLSPNFDKKVLDESLSVSREISKNDIKKRIDFRGVSTFTIDPKDAKDFDDAFSVKELENSNWEIGIHIADVSHYVKENGFLDKESFNRSCSVYLVDRVVPMLPEKLSNDLCSLKQGVDRLCYSVIFEFDDNLNLISYKIHETIIHSNKRFTYENAQKTINDKKGLFFKELDLLNKTSKKLRKKRFDFGSINFEREEVKFILDKDKNPIDIYLKKIIETNNLVEEFMLLTNRVISKEISINKSLSNKPFIYRVHDKPDPEKLKSLSVFVKKFGYILDVNSIKNLPFNLNNLLTKIKGSNNENIIETLCIRSMSKAIYSTDNIGHFGLNFKYYSHFTSPIRRYPDLITHRLLKLYLKNYSYNDNLNYISDYCSKKEKDASLAERDSIKFMQTKYLSYKIGKTLKGTISSVKEWGFYVEINDIKCEGLVKISSLKNDYYLYNEKSHSIYGKSSNKTYRLGDEVNVKIKNCNLQKKQSDFICIS